MSVYCVSCGKALSNDSARENFASWTFAGPGVDRLPYCADSIMCALDAYQRVRVAGLATQ